MERSADGREEHFPFVISHFSIAILKIQIGRQMGHDLPLGALQKKAGTSVPHSARPQRDHKGYPDCFSPSGLCSWPRKPDRGATACRN
jgi:hypothetical protein